MAARDISRYASIWYFLLAATCLIILLTAGFIAMPYVLPNYAFRNSPLFSQVLAAYERGGWDFDGGWPRINNRFPHAVADVERKWITDASDTEKKFLLEFAGHMFIEGFQVSNGLEVLRLGLHSTDPDVRNSTVGFLIYGRGHLHWDKSALLQFLETEIGITDEVSEWLRIVGVQ
jgi:hypothetical protein